MPVNRGEVAVGETEAESREQREREQDRQARALIEEILELSAERGLELVFHAKPRKKGLRGRLKRDRRGDAKTGWRIGYYHRSAPTILESGYRITQEWLHPVYLLSDGRLVVGTLRAVESDGSVAELEPRRSRGSSWFKPLEDCNAFFAVRPGYYLTELNALRDKLAGT